jgi:hypothetical protein
VERLKKYDFAERKIERKRKNLEVKKDRSNAEESTFFTGVILAGYRDVSPHFMNIAAFIENEERNVGKDIWEKIPEEERSALLSRTGELKSLLEKIEKKAKQ